MLGPVSLVGAPRKFNSVSILVEADTVRSSLLNGRRDRVANDA